MVHNEDGSVSFNLSKEQWEKYKNWRKLLPKNVYFGATGGGIAFEFIPTSIGNIERVVRYDSQAVSPEGLEDQMLDLTDYSNW